MKSPSLEDFIKILEAWQRITKFMGICCLFKIKYANDEIDNKALQHEEDISDFQMNAKLLCKHGKSNTLCKKEDGDKKFLCAHAALNCMPKEAECLCSISKLGLGTYSAQRFERRNKESKNLRLRFSNNRHILSQ